MNNDPELHKIFNYVQKLEKRLIDLESKEAIIVEGSLKNQQPKPLQLSLDKLIDLYNDVPHILTEYAIEVSLTAESYQQKTNKQVILEKVIRGNYWVILLENIEEKSYYLLPNGNKKLRIYKLKTIDNLFIIKGEKNLNTEEFTLVKPAFLEILPSGKEWQILEKGELYIEKKSSASKLVSALEKIAENETIFPQNLEKLLIILEKLNQGNSTINAQIKLLDERLQKLEPDDGKFINLYSQNPQKFAQLEGGSKRLKVTKQTIKDFLQNTMNSVYLEINEEGEYLLKKGDKDEYLFPDPLLIFDKMTLVFARQGKLFQIKNEIPIAILGKDIKIKKPAKVRRNGDVWLLIESGEISL